MSCADLYRGVLVHKCYHLCTSLFIAPERGVFRSHDLFKLWEISDNVSEMVQDEDVVAMEV